MAKLGDQASYQNYLNILVNRPSMVDIVRKSWDVVESVVKEPIQVEGAFDVVDGADASKSGPSLRDLKEKAPDHPDFKPKKNWDQKKVKTPSGKGAGWPDKKGNVWEPTDHKGTHRPHWDVQHPDGSHTNVYPETTLKTN